MYSSFFDEINIKNILGEDIVLDENQCKVVSSSAHSIMVYAGAGSGKTTTIIARIKYLVEKRGIDPRHILLMSYTRETVKELYWKLHKKYRLPVKVQTFHQFALSLLSSQSRGQIVADASLILYPCLEKLLKDKIFCKKCVDAYSHYMKGPSFLISYMGYSFYKKMFFAQEKNEFILSSFVSFLENQIVQIKSGNLSTKVENSMSKIEKNRREILDSIFKTYQFNLEKIGGIDFEDMILRGIRRVQENEFIPSYQYVIVDEYQDISPNRAALLYDYVTKVRANIMVVGDDFQSIYGFSGGDVTLFTHFTEEIKNTEAYYITKTYRNSFELIEVAGKFIMKNKNQIAKVLVSDKKIEKPLVFCYTNRKREVLCKILDKIVSLYGETESVLLLGRYQFDLQFLKGNPIFSILPMQIIYKKYPLLKVQFLTVHGAKGLEFDHVILLNTETGIYGFPSNVEDVFTRKKQDSYLYAEERRLFYVALTRTKNKIYFIILKDSISPFIEELKQDAMVHISYL